MKHPLIFAMSALMIAALSAPAFSDPNAVIEPQEAGQINWSQGKLRVTGTGVVPPDVSESQRRLLARRAAISDAYRLMGALVNGVQVSSATRVEQYMVKNDTIRNRVTAMIKGAKMVGEERITPDGAFQVDLEVPLYGVSSLAKALDLGRLMKTKQAQLSWSTRAPLFEVFSPVQVGVNPKAMEAAGAQPAPLPTPTPLPSPKAVQTSGTPTGIVIDARGLNIQPAMSPAVFYMSSQGPKQVYIGDFKLDIDKVISQGIITYYPTLEAAKGAEGKVGENPLVVKAVGTQPGQIDLVISAEDAQKIVALNQSHKLLEELKVAAII